MSLFGWNRRRTFIVAFVTSLLAYVTLGIFGATPASAVTTCSFSLATGVLDVVMSSDGAFDEAGIGAYSNGEIRVSGALCPGDTALLSNVATIRVRGANNEDDFVLIAMYDEFASGIDWGDINWDIDVGTASGAGLEDFLMIDGSPMADGTALNIALGVDGIDLNNDGNLDLGPLVGFDDWRILGTPNDDTISAAGSSATGAPFESNLQSAGFPGILGFSGKDTIAGGKGDDILFGGTGADLLDDSGAGAAVVVNLAAGISTGSGLDVVSEFENVVGSDFGDILSGDAGPNRVLGGPGIDEIAGQEGDDFMNGGRGKDDVDGGPDTDTCVRGPDAFISCDAFIGGGPNKV